MSVRTPQHLSNGTSSLGEQKGKLERSLRMWLDLQMSKPGVKGHFRKGRKYRHYREYECQKFNRPLALVHMLTRETRKQRFYTAGKTRQSKQIRDFSEEGVAA